MVATVIYGLLYISSKNANVGIDQRSSRRHTYSLDYHWVFQLCIINCDRIGPSNSNINADADFYETVIMSGLQEACQVGVGSKFTSRGVKHYATHSKIDRTFLNSEFQVKLPNALKQILNHSTSDHSPTVISFMSENKGRKNAPFSFNNAWTEIRGYEDIVKHAWETNIRGNSLYIFLHKLKKV